MFYSVMFLKLWIMIVICVCLVVLVISVKFLSRVLVDGVGVGMGRFEVVGDCWKEEEVVELGLEGDEMGVFILIVGCGCDVEIGSELRWFFLGCDRMKVEVLMIRLI